MEKAPDDDAFLAIASSMEAALIAAEKRLGISQGILSTAHSEPDYVLIIKAYATIEPLINELLYKGFSKNGGGLGGMSNSDLFAPVSNYLTKLQMSGYVNKLELCQIMGMLDEEDIQFCKAVGRIRNRYAHNIKNAERPLSEIYLDEYKTDANFLSKLVGSKGLTHSMLNGQFDGVRIVVLFGLSIFLRKVETRLKIEVKGLLDLFGDSKVTTVAKTLKSTGREKN